MHGAATAVVSPRVRTQPLNAGPAPSVFSLSIIPLLKSSFTWEPQKMARHWILGIEKRRGEDMIKIGCLTGNSLKDCRLRFLKKKKAATWTNGCLILGHSPLREVKTETQNRNSSRSHGELAAY